MKKTILFAALAGFILTSGCRKIEVDGTATNTPTTENTTLSGRISSDRTLKASEVYTLRGLVYVTDGATLTIEAGTRSLVKRIQEAH